jgi:hypothetical protein
MRLLSLEKGNLNILKNVTITVVYLKIRSIAMASCFFIGHRTVPTAVREKLDREIERHIMEYGVDTFLVGRYGEFDGMVVAALAAAKQHHPSVTLLLCTAYLPTECKVAVPKGFDGIYFPEGQELVPRRVAISRLNQTLIKQTEYLIAYVQYISSGSYRALEFAKTQEREGRLHITMLSPP